MNKSDTIIQITSDVLDRYRSSIPRKAFTRAMEQVIELVLDCHGTDEDSQPRTGPDPVSGYGCREPCTDALRCLSALPGRVLG